MTIYAASSGPKYEQILSWIGSHKRVLDVGCWGGAFTARIAEKMLREHGFEILEFASPKPRRAPRWYQLLVNIRPEFFGIQLMYRCRVAQ
jgi:hypothetical protein